MASERSDRVAVVTGAASGVGAATMRRFLEAGVACVGVDLAGPHDVGGPDGAPSAWVSGDVASEDTWKAVIERASTLGGTPRILVLAAAQLVVGTIEELDLSTWKRLFDVNVFGAVQGIKACVPGMVSAGGGSIVTVASVDAFMAEQGLVAYCASKGALLQLTRSVALDYARQGVRANCVCPGVIDTPFFRGHLATTADPAAVLAAREERNPVGRLLDAEEVAEVVDFVARTSSGALLGASVVVDGGLSVGFEYHA